MHLKANFSHSARLFIATVDFATALVQLRIVFSHKNCSFTDRNHNQSINISLNTTVF